MRQGKELEGKSIVLGMTGSIAAVESFELVRELIRHGADVQVVMTAEAAKLMTPYTMEFASGHKVITELTGATEHVSLLGDYAGEGGPVVGFPVHGEHHLQDGPGHRRHPGDDHGHGGHRLPHAGAGGPGHAPGDVRAPRGARGTWRR